MLGLMFQLPMLQSVHPKKKKLWSMRSWVCLVILLLAWLEAFRPLLIPSPERAAVLFPHYSRSSLLLTTRTLPGYPITAWPNDTAVGRGTSRSSPTTHGALVSILPDNASGATILNHFRLTQPFNHVHKEEDEPTLLCLHLASVPGRDEDEWVLSDIARDFRRGWKKNMVRVGEHGSQRVWTSLADGRHVRPVVSYNDLSTRPFPDRTLDL